MPTLPRSCTVPNALDQDVRDWQEALETKSPAVGHKSGKFRGRKKDGAPVKKRHKRYLIAFVIGWFGAACLIAHAMYTRGLEPNFTRVFAFPVMSGVLFVGGAWRMNFRRIMTRREREDFRRRGWNWNAYRNTVLVIAILIGYGLIVYKFYAR